MIFYKNNFAKMFLTTKLQLTSFTHTLTPTDRQTDRQTDTHTHTKKQWRERQRHIVYFKFLCSTKLKVSAALRCCCTHLFSLIYRSMNYWAHTWYIICYQNKSPNDVWPTICPDSLGVQKLIVINVVPNINWTTLDILKRDGIV